MQPGQPKLIFILGTAFSGSTLLGQILSNRPNATFVGELYDVNQGWRKAQCSCPQRLDCEFWNGIQFDETVYQQLLRCNKGLGTQYRDSEERFWEKRDNHILGSNGNVIEQIRLGKSQGSGAIEHRDPRSHVLQAVPGWAERSEQATAVHHELLKRV